MNTLKTGIKAKPPHQSGLSWFVHLPDAERARVGEAVAKRAAERQLKQLEQWRHA